MALFMDAVSFPELLPQRRAANVQVLLAELKACSKTRNIERGKRIHAEAVERGHDSCTYVANALINMYSKCGNMFAAREVFEQHKHPTVVSWTALILGYADNGQGYTALDLFATMRSDGLEPDHVTFVASLKACISLGVKDGESGWGECKDRGKALHILALQNGCISDVFVQSTLLDMYSKSGSMVNACELFETMKHPDVVSWNVLILGYAENGESYTALSMLTKMRAESSANYVTFVAALKACASIAVNEGASVWAECRNWGKAMHNLAAENGFDSNNVRNTLIDVYGKCGSMVDAREVFDSVKHPDVVSWTALVMGYADNGQDLTALHLFTKMRTEGPASDYVTFVAALKACTALATKEGAECMDRGKAVHNIAAESDCTSHIYVQNTLIDMYAKYGSMLDARQVFDCVKNPNLVSWNVLIGGYADNDEGHTALDLFTRLSIEGPAPNSITFMAVFKACGLLGALEFGRTIHSQIVSKNALDMVLVNCLVDFYAKCGSLIEAKSIFDSYAQTRNLVTWNALLAGFSSCGDSEVVFELFERMQDAGFRPDSITLLCILTCCSHVGLVERGKELFEVMFTKYGIIPTLKHYTCMIDLFGRANMLDDAMALVERMPCNLDDVTWMNILGACQKWKNLEIGRLAFQSWINLNGRDAIGYVLMGQIYGSRGMLQEQEMVMGFRKKLKYCKKSGESCWTNDVGVVHKFVTEDCRHPQIDEIREKWESMALVMRQHVSNLNVTSDIRDTESEKSFCSHSERLALVCALINTEPQATVRIVKNTKICDDCHSAVAFISELENRTIICRDASRIHSFTDGKCSCGDLW